jgi:hypothetical protein
MEKELKSRLINVYSTVAEALGFYPRISDLEKVGINDKYVYKNFSGLNQLKEAAIKAKPKAFKNVRDRRKTSRAFSDDKKQIYNLLGVELK